MPAIPSTLDTHRKSTSQSNSQNTTSNIPLSPSTHPETPPSSLRAIHHFHNRTSKFLGGWLLAPFWTTQLPQLAHSHPSIQHAIIAISSIHENIDRARETTTHDLRLKQKQKNSASTSLTCFAESHYQAAVSALARSLAAGLASEVVALTNCALFVCFNFISEGNFARAVWHMQYGLEILSRWKRRWERESLSVGQEGSLEANLVELMKRISLDGEAMEETVSIGERDDIDLDTFQDLEEAGSAVLALSKEGLRLIRLNVLVEKGDAGAARREVLGMDVAAHIENLALWQAALEALISDPLFLLTAEDKDLISQLRILHLSARIWIHAGFPPTQHVQYTKLFAIFINLVDEQYEMWRSRGLERYARTFLFDKGILPTINYIVTCSSNEEVKARAVDVWVKSSPG
ncbi:hypothetical protein BKA65DRAFT_157463 [Rhexocercosporidium sp. MPI-PUGE-AT-0058]|nr:hypothetical protein BKA65DRAFT_157463 [Rhexocercosporidium sp. MPI-PUGE-AT-0058]